jgi:DNA-binding LacI/PurR family transcriptional regulator
LGPAGEIVVAGAGLLEDGPRALKALLGQADPPTAVLCYNDLAAIGLLAAAARAGLRVPDNLAVIGYDNIPLSAFCVPALTTVDQPKEQMGRTAVTMCLQALAGEPVRNVVLKGRLILRDSAVHLP